MVSRLASSTKSRFLLIAAALTFITIWLHYKPQIIPEGEGTPPGPVILIADHRKLVDLKVQSLGYEPLLRNDFVFTKMQRVAESEIFQELVASRADDTDPRVIELVRYVSDVTTSRYVITSRYNVTSQRHNVTTPRHNISSQRHVI